MDPNRTTGEEAPARQESNATATDTEACDPENDSQQTLARGDCDSTNIRAIQGDTGVGRHPTDDGPYACNDCGWHGDPVEREKQTGGKGRRGLAGQLASTDDADELLTDGGEATETIWTLTCLDCDFNDEIHAEGHPRDGPPKKVEKRVTRHKHTTDTSHVVRVAGDRADRDGSIDPSMVTDGGVLTGGRDEVDATDLTQFELNLLAILAGDGTPEPTDYGLAIKRALEAYYDEEINHGRLYPNLDGLIDRGLVETRAVDDRTNEYVLTDKGRGVLDARLDWLIDQTGTAGHDPAAITGEDGAAGGAE